MKLILESTARLVAFSTRRGSKPIQCRVWDGKSESGIAVQVLIPYIVSLKQGEQEKLEEELRKI